MAIRRCLLRALLVDLLRRADPLRSMKHFTRRRIPFCRKYRPVTSHHDRVSKEFDSRCSMSAVKAHRRVQRDCIPPHRVPICTVFPHHCWMSTCQHVQDKPVKPPTATMIRCNRLSTSTPTASTIPYRCAESARCERLHPLRVAGAYARSPLHMPCCPVYLFSDTPTHTNKQVDMLCEVPGRPEKRVRCRAYPS